MSLATLRGFRDKAGIMVPSSAVPECSSFVVLFGNNDSLVVTADTKRTARPGYVIFETRPSAVPPLVHATRVLRESEKAHAYATVKRRRYVEPTRPIIRFTVSETLPCVVQYFDGGINRYMVFPKDFDVALQDEDRTIFHNAPLESWLLENPLRKSLVAASPTAVLECMLSDRHDSLASESSDRWINGMFSEFFEFRAKQSPRCTSLDTPAFVMLCTYVFSATLFSTAWNSMPEIKEHPVSISRVHSFIESKEAVCLSLINSFVQCIVSPTVQYMEETLLDVESLIPLFLGKGVLYERCKHIPEKIRHMADVPDILFVFHDVFALPPKEFVSSGRYYINKGRLFAWNSQLRAWMVRELKIDSSEYYASVSDTARRVASKIMHLVRDVFAMDMARTHRTRAIRDAAYRHWLLESNPYSKPMHDAFMVGMTTGNPTSITALVIRMKTGIEYALAQCKIQPGWRHGKVDCKRTDDGRTRVSFSVCGLKECIAEGCHPHQSDSHMFCTAFTDFETQPTTVFFQSRASGNHPSARNKGFGTIAIATVPVNPLTDPIEFRRLKSTSSR